MRWRFLLAVLAAALVPRPALAQANPTQQDLTEADRDVPVYRVTVVARTTPAVNYRYRGDTKIDLAGTPLLPRAEGEAEIESEPGYIRIEAKFDDLEPATRFGREYLTYVLWAITPEGRATNLGEIVLDDEKGKLEVTTELQAFGLIVTAEPYFAVTQPSDVVVMENRLRKDTRGTVVPVVARYELLQRGTYLMAADASSLEEFELDDDTPLALYQARNAVRLARLAHADRYATDTFARAASLLGRAEEEFEDDGDSREMFAVARQAVQQAEDARLISLERQIEEADALVRAEAERRAEETARREARARAQAQAEAEKRRKAEARVKAADQARREAEAEARRASEATMEAERAREAAERAREAAEAATARLAEERAAAEAARLAAAEEAARARAAVAASEAEREALRARLREQLDVILETRETARGLVVSMPDVLFDFDQATLRPGAREKLARVAGVLLSYPDLQVEVEGHTDNVGTDGYNQALSERRASSVRSYLVGQGVRAEAVEARGFGEGRPVVTNETPEGRQQNRRVELVVSGDAIGVPDLTSRR